jgi:ParB-like chromosome segregation protein Spo0J
MQQFPGKVTTKPMKIHHEKTAALIPYARNSRTHSEAQISQIAGSIREFGFTNPVLTDGANGIIAGHGRVMAAQKLGLETVPCIRLDHLTESQKRAYIIADNKLALNAGWDEELLGLELVDLREADFDLSLTGFDADAIEAALNPGEIVNDPQKEWEDGMPEFEQEDKSGIRCVIHFETEEHKSEFEALVGQQIPKNTKAIWFPKKERSDADSYRYE